MRTVAALLSLLSAVASNGQLSDLVTRQPSVALQLSSTRVAGGNGVTATLTLIGPTIGGATIKLSSTHAAVTVPGLVYVAPGATLARFSITTSPVSDDTQIEIYGEYETIKRRLNTLTVLAPTFVSLTGVDHVVGHSANSAVAEFILQLSGPAPADWRVEATTTTPNGVRGSQHGVSTRPDRVVIDVSSEMARATGPGELAVVRGSQRMTARFTVHVPGLMTVNPASPLSGNQATVTVRLNAISSEAETFRLQWPAQAPCRAVKSTPDVVVIPAGEVERTFTLNIPPSLTFEDMLWLVQTPGGTGSRADLQTGRPLVIRAPQPVSFEVPQFVFTGTPAIMTVKLDGSTMSSDCGQSYLTLLTDNPSVQIPAEVLLPPDVREVTIPLTIAIPATQGLARIKVTSMRWHPVNRYPRSNPVTLEAFITVNP